MILCILSTLLIYEIILCLENTSNVGIRYTNQLIKFGITENDDNTSLAQTECFKIISHKLKNLFTLQSIEKN